jgi:GT2 family glycosyltransferase
MIIESNLGDIEEIKNLNFKYGCVIPIFERQEYVTSTFLSISRSFIPKETIFIIIDDCSEFELFLPEEFYNKGFNYIKIKKSKNLGVANSLAIGFDILNLLSCEFFINLDSDVEVLNHWLIDLHKAYKYFVNLLIFFLVDNFIKL